MLGEAAQGPRKQHKTHMDNISDRGFVFDFHCGIVHKPIARKYAMNVPDAKAAAAEELDKLTNLQAWDFESNPSQRFNWHSGLATVDTEPLLKSLGRIGQVK